ncbi:hypothetical protein, partial [uncultured Actinomyces sp.]|uniref:hypothetical protein n=1 Tax=uncultured Actinomyces sp. TaxID=249061 RepID=UPI002889C05C
ATNSHTASQNDFVKSPLYKTEVDRYPRDQEFIPDWLREKLERWRVEHGPAVAKRVAQLEVEFRLKGRTFRYP